MNFNIDFNTIKELMMNYGFFTVAITLTVCACLILLCLRLPAILHELNERKRIDK